MSRSQRARWWNSAALVGFGLAIAPLLFLLGHAQTAGAVVLLAVAAAWFVAPVRRSDDIHHWEAQERLVREGRLIVYWRPGCLSCARLRLRLGSLGAKATWVDIWADAEAAAFVRDVNHGNETVPTVILAGGDAIANPDPARVRAELVGYGQAA